MNDTLLWGTPYRPTRRLGRGGMGEVIEAEHVGLGKAVVVKLLHPDLNGRPAAVERMRVEAQALARLAHPNLVAVTDFGRTAEGRTYLVMERLYGRTLRQELAARGALPAAEAIGYVVQALAGLEAAHGAGVVHRDVKLDNLFVCDPDPAGRRAVKVLDFGIAKVIAPGGGAPAPSLFQTEEGVVVGTPRYLSPEQARGEAVDARADVYAAGAVLYTLLAGRAPFEHREILDLLRAHAEEIPDPPSRHAPGAIPPELDRAVMKALEKDPRRRFPGACAFAERLAAIAGELPPGAAAPAPRGRWTTTEPLDRAPPAGSPAQPAPRSPPPPDEVPSRWVRTAPLSAPPVRARIETTIEEPAGWRDPRAGAPRRASGPPGQLDRPNPRKGAPDNAFLPALVLGALVLGFALAVIFRLGG